MNEESEREIPTDPANSNIPRKVGESTPAAREESDSYYRSFFEASSDGMLLTIADGTILDANSKACGLLQRTREEVIAVGRNGIFDPSDPRLKLALGEQRRTRRFRGELRLLQQDGAHFPVEVSIGAYRDEVGGDRLCIVFRDVTERKRVEEENRRLNEALEERVAERTAQLAEREDQLKDLLGKLVVVAQEEEPHRVAYDVHDGLAQVAIAAYRHLQAFVAAHPPGSIAGGGELGRALELVRQTVGEARRVIAGLRPTALDDFGLATAIRQQVETLRAEGWQIFYEEALGEERLPPETETALYRVAQEAGLTALRAIVFGALYYRVRSSSFG